MGRLSLAELRAVFPIRICPVGSYYFPLLHLGEILLCLERWTATACHWNICEGGAFGQQGTEQPQAGCKSNSNMQIRINVLH